MEELLTLFPELQLLPERRRVRCLLSGHEMPCDVGVVKQYLEGKRFRKLKEVKVFDYKKYEPLIVASVKRRNTLYCQLTGRYINMVPSHVEKHTNGKKFIRARKNFKEGLKELKYETKVKRNQENAGNEKEESSSEVEEKNDSSSDEETEKKEQPEEMEEEDHHVAHDEQHVSLSKELSEEKLLRKRKSNAMTNATSTKPVSKRRKLLKLARLRRSRVTT